MSQTRKVSGMMLVTLEVPFSADIDLKEFAEWSGGENLDSWEATAYLEADRDYPRNLNMVSVSPGMRVVSEEIDRVEL